MKQDMLSFLFEFSQADLETLDHPNRRKLIYDISYILLGGGGRVMDTPEEFKKSHLGIKNFFDKFEMLSHSAGMDKETIGEFVQAFLPPQYQELPQMLPRLQKRIRAAIDNLYNAIEENVSPHYHLDTVATTLQLDCSIGQPSTVLTPVEHPPLEDNPIVVKVHMTGFMEQAILTIFYKSMDGVPIKAFRVCPECGKRYVHNSGKRRIYCENNCAARAGSRRKRERIRKDKEKYDKELLKSTQRARKHYEKTVPYGKPESRPYKHKDTKKED